MTSQQTSRLIEKINKKVDIITYLVAIKAMEGYPLEDRIIKLLVFDFSVKDISKIVNRPTKEVNRIIRAWRKQS